jgi:hypothetical protein
VIAKSKVGEVMVCPDCGVVHLNLASVSVRFSLEAFEELSSMLSEAQIVLEHAQQLQAKTQGTKERNSFESESAEVFH